MTRGLRIDRVPGPAVFEGQEAIVSIETWPIGGASAVRLIYSTDGIAWDTDYPDACWEWITFLDEQMPPFTIPARRSMAESDAYRERVGQETADVALMADDLVRGLYGGVRENAPWLFRALTSARASSAFSRGTSRSIMPSLL